MLVLFDKGVITDCLTGSKIYGWRKHTLANVISIQNFLTKTWSELRHRIHSEFFMQEREPQKWT